MTVSNSTTWLIGGVAHWDPVKNLDFEFELLYQSTTTRRRPVSSLVFAGRDERQLPG